MDSISYGGEMACDQKRFAKTKSLEHKLEILHHFFTPIIWLVIILLLADTYNHFLDHTTHEIIIWCEFICYSLFLLVPMGIKIYQRYKIKQCYSKLE